MEYHYAPRITLSFDAIQEYVKILAETCGKVAVFEHPADTKVKHTHCHLLLLGSPVKAEALKRKWPGEPPGKGQEFWKWESKYGTPDESFIQYMTKGKYAAKFLKNISPATVEEWRTKWVDKSTAPKADKSKEKEMLELLKGFESRYECNDFKSMTGYTDEIMEQILGLCRTYTMSHIYHKTGFLPFPGTYKQTAGTLFLRVIEKHRTDCFNEALSALKNIWY